MTAQTGCFSHCYRVQADGTLSGSGVTVITGFKHQVLGEVGLLLWLIIYDWSCFLGVGL